MTKNWYRSYQGILEESSVSESDIQEDMIQQPNSANTTVQPQQAGQTDTNTQPQQSAPGAVKPQGSQSAADLHQATLNKAAQANSGGVNSVPDMLKQGVPNGNNNNTSTPMRPNLNEAEVDTITGAAFWAPFLINGDSSGLDEEEIHACNEWYQKNVPDGWHVVDCGEPHFSMSFGMFTGLPANSGDVVEYTIAK